ncbi:hypothetical protein JXQ70_20120 [bacterium]|nr:hypothetical protein [bacterium]
MRSLWSDGGMVMVSKQFFIFCTFYNTIGDTMRELTGYGKRLSKQFDALNDSKECNNDRFNRLSITA